MERTKIGNWLYNFINKLGEKLIKHKKLIYILNYTWGILTTLVGWIVYAIINTLLKNKCVIETGKFAHCKYTLMKGNWGGVSIGMTIFMSSLSLKNHELGHSVQNAILGPLFIFLVAIPSVIRYYYRDYCVKKHGDEENFALPAYDKIWFEGSATYIGDYYVALKNK